MKKILIAALAMIAGVSAASAQSYPSRPVTAIVPASAGGPTDTIARVVMSRAQELLGQTIVIENIGGASGTIGTGKVVRAEPDGYTIGIGGPNHYVVNGSVYSLPYDLLKDFAPVAMLSNGPQIIITRNTLPVQNLKELIAYLKANPDKVTFGTGGLASPPHVSGLSFESQIGTKFQFVPFRGAAPALLAIMSGHVDMTFDQASGALSTVRSGGVRAYAVTAKQRLTSAPDIPTVDEAGLPGFYVSIWQGVFAPKGTPKDAITKLNVAIRGALADPAIQKKLADIGQELPSADQMTPEGFGAYHKAEMERWTPIIKAADLKVQ